MNESSGIHLKDNIGREEKTCLLLFALCVLPASSYSRLAPQACLWTPTVVVEKAILDEEENDSGSL